MITVNFRSCVSVVKGPTNQQKIYYEIVGT
jgi:hypothetical protein